MSDNKIDKGLIRIIEKRWSVCDDGRVNGCRGWGMDVSKRMKLGKDCEYELSGSSDMRMRNK